MTWGVALCVAFALFAAALVLQAPIVAGAAGVKQSTPESDERRLIGRWVRTDAAYILELKGIGEGSSLKAAYFNPRPINVARAGFKRRDGRLTVFVELRDVNYPGSTYNLEYDSVSDRLKGTYFQALEKQTFVIEFVRAR